MFKNSKESLNGVPTGGEAFEWKEKEAKKDTSLVKNTNIPPPTTFKIYDKVSEKNRYIPRKWTQEEFEASLPQRFKEGSKKSNPYPIEDDFKNDKKQSSASSKETLTFPSTAASRCPRKRPEINEKISNLKAIFEGVQNEDDCDQQSDISNELKNCKESEANITLTNEQGSQETTDRVIGEVKYEESEHIFIESRQNAFTSFIDGCLQCLLNLEPIAQSLIAPAAKTYSSFAGDELRTVLSSDKSSQEELQQLCLQDIFPKLYKEAQEQSRSCDEVLEFLLDTLLDENHLRSVFQGKFCHATVCERCATVVKEYQPFLFLNPASPSSESHTLLVNLFTCNNSVWQLSPKEISISPGMTVASLKEELLNYPEFLGTHDVSAIELGEVKESCLDKVFDDAEELLGLGRTLGTIVAFHVVNCHSELNHLSETDEDNPAKAVKSRSRGFANMSYHLYFNCGLCLNDGKEVGLLMHQSCGGMVCRDCLDEILQTNTGWELCPCPICERPIDLDKEFCETSVDANRNQDTQSDVVFVVVLRTAFVHHGRGSSVELFGCPLLVSLPQETSGFQLYRFIGYLLPKGLPMKNKTSFTLHKVDKSGRRCAAAGCSSTDCTGCLVRINDNLTLQPDTCLAVHFDDLEEASKTDFGMNIHETARISKTQALFDGILRSCVEGCSSMEMLCPKCFNVSKTTSSILKFPQLLIIHLNKQFAIKGLPTNTTIAEVASFFTLERGNESCADGKPGLMYQLTAAVLQPENSSVSTVYQTCAVGANNKWVLYDGLQVNERHPTQLYLTSDSVLFYEPVTDPESQLLNGEVRQFLQSTTVSEKSEGAGESNDSNHPAYDIYHRQLLDVNALDPIAEGHEAIKQRSRKEYSTTNNQVHNNVSFMLKSTNSQVEPGEWFPGKDLLTHDNNRRLPQPGVNCGSRLSLGEMERGGNTVKHRKRMTGAVLDDIDTISPIYTTDFGKSESRVIKETKKLVKAVKKEDAYEIVCSLNRGADPCLPINDVSALHLAAGIKSDQRRCILTYLLRYCSDDVNVPTSDGTTPIHVAAAWGHQDALELLLIHGGDPFELTDLEGHSAFDIAANDCSTYLQSVYHHQHSARPLELSSSSYASLPISHLSKRPALKDEDVNRKEKRLEDLVRSNICLPSFVEDHSTRTRIRRRWIHRLRNFRERSSGVFRNLRKISRIRRRSRIGVMVMETALENKSNENNLHLKTSSSLI